MSKVGLVLSGGGSKGAYEIGVCIALKHLGKKIDIVTGTSIGAINGMMLVQHDIRKAIKLWRNISFEKIYDEQIFPQYSDDKITLIYKEYVKAFINDGGMDVTKLEKIIHKYYNAKKFYRSKIDYGLVTYNISKHKPVLLCKKDMPLDKVPDYVLASSACYPAFKPKKIDNNLYIDGGYYDNFPINLAINMGADEIIGVDLRAVGFKRDIANKKVPVVIITPKNKIASFLVFDKSKSREAISFGYNDTLKKYGKLDGNIFTFRKGDLAKNYNKYNHLMNCKMSELIKNLNQNFINRVLSIPIIKNTLNNKFTYKSFNTVIENAGKIFEINESSIYSIRIYNHKLLNRTKETTTFNLNDIKKEFSNKNLKNIVDRAKIVKLFFETINENDINSVSWLIPLFIDEFLAALYVFVINNNYSKIKR